VRRSVAPPAGATLDAELPLPHPASCRGCGEPATTQLLLCIPRAIIGRRTPADKFLTWSTCEPCIAELPPTLRESVRPPEEDEDMPNPHQTLAAAARAAETARVARVPGSTRCIIVRYQRTLHETEYTRRRCDMPVSTKHETGACFRCSSYLRRHEIDFDGLDLVHVDDEGLVIETPLLGVWAPYAKRRPVDAGDPGDLVEETADEPSDADVVADYDQEIIDGLRVRIAELEREVAERDALVERLEGEVEEQTQALLVAESDKFYLSSALRESEAKIGSLEERVALLCATDDDRKKLVDAQEEIAELRGQITHFTESVRLSFQAAVNNRNWNAVVHDAGWLRILDPEPHTGLIHRGSRADYGPLSDCKPF
jgi:hypothetical protein